MKRLFLALPIAERSRAQIIQSILSSETLQKMPVRWVPIQNLHLTLHFLGDVEEKKLPLLKQMLEMLPSPDLPEFLEFKNIGAFPGYKAPRIIWIGFNRSDFLRKIHQILDAELQKNGFGTDKKAFKPHLTLGRVKDGSVVSSADMDILNEIRNRINIDDSHIERITLFESRLHPGAPVYLSLHEKKL